MPKYAMRSIATMTEVLDLYTRHPLRSNTKGQSTSTTCYEGLRTKNVLLPCWYILWRLLERFHDYGERPCVRSWRLQNRQLLLSAQLKWSLPTLSLYWFHSGPFSQSVECCVVQHDSRLYKGTPDKDCLRLRLLYTGRTRNNRRQREGLAALVVSPSKEQPW
jgi:hypothetical protein